MSSSDQRSDLKWGYLAQGLNVGSGLLLLPFVVRYLPAEEVGLWFVFITLGALAQLLEFGFQPTIARNTAYVYAGARTLFMVGIPTELKNCGLPHIPMLAELIAACRLIYAAVALLVAFALFGGGGLYISTLLADGAAHDAVLIAWAMYATGLIVNFYFGYANSLLQGRGDITLVNKALIASRCLLLLLGLFMLALGQGLPGLGAAMLASCILGRWLLMRYLRQETAMAEAMRLRSTQGRATAQTMWHNASRLGVVQVSAFLIQRANVLVASSFLGLVSAASYGLTVTLLITLSNLSMAVLQIRLPAITRARTLGDNAMARALFGEVLLMSWILFMGGLALLLVAGNPLLFLLSGQAPLLHTLPLLVFGLILALEMNHSIAATYLTTRNAVPFLWPSLLSGAATLLLSLWLVSEWEVWGLIAAQGVVQLSYNNWRWPSMARQELHGSWSDIIGAGSIRLRDTFISRTT